VRQECSRAAEIARGVYNRRLRAEHPVNGFPVLRLSALKNRAPALAL
jgi:hypothetical protein